MDAPKIVFPDIATSPRFALDVGGFYGSNTVYFIPLEDLYLLGLVNSRVGCFYFTNTCASLEGANQKYLRFFGQYLEGFPVRPMDFSRLSDKARYDKMVSLVQRMLDLHKRLQAAKTDHERTALERQIAATDDKIDHLVNEPYATLRDYNNYFLPSLKLKEKVRDGARITRRYHSAKTPYARVLDSPHVARDVKDKLTAHYRTLNPAALRSHSCRALSSAQAEPILRTIQRPVQGKKPATLAVDSYVRQQVENTLYAEIEGHKSIPERRVSASEVVKTDTGWRGMECQRKRRRLVVCPV